LARNGSATFCGDGGAAAGACLRAPYGVAADAAGNVFIADTGNNRVRKVTLSTKKITTVAGGGTAGLGDNGPATKAVVSTPYGVAVFPNTSAAKSLYIANVGNRRIRRVTLQ